MANDSNVLAVWGNKESMNLNSLLLNNIMTSRYFKVSLYEKKTFEEIVDEIYYQVKHLEPWERGSRKTSGLTGMCGEVRGVGGGGIVSTAYCILYKLYTLKLTRQQVITLTIHQDSPFIRAVGFMYIRYTQPPPELFEWFEEYLDDTETLDVKAGGGCTMSIGQMLRQWLTQIEWYNTLFPRIPVPTQKEITQKLHEHGPYRGDDYGDYSSYDYNEEQQHQKGNKSSNAIEMPETFGNVASSSSNDRNGYNKSHYSSSDAYRHKNYRSSRDDRSRSRSAERQRHRPRDDDNSDRYRSHKDHHRRRSSSRDDRRRHHQRSRSPAATSDSRSRNYRYDRP